MSIDPTSDLYYAKFLGNYNNDFYLKYVSLPNQRLPVSSAA